MFFDLHNDFATALPVDKYDEYLNNNAGDGIVAAAIFTTELEKATAARTVNDITANLMRTGMPIAIEDMGFIGGDYNNFDFSPYLYCSLTWNYNNAFAGGALDDGSLTKAGRSVIEKINCRCALDLAHINRKSFFDALDAAKHPMCSHTGFNGHLRSLTHEQIKALINRQGIIGVSSVVAFTDANTCKQLATVIDGFVQKYGVEYLSLGTDFNGTTNLPVDFKDYNDIALLSVELQKLGYNDCSINKILYENALRFYKEIKGEGHLREPVDNTVCRQKNGGDIL